MRPGTTPYEPQKRKESRAEMNPERLRPRAEFLASINLSESQTWDYPLKTLPRLTGRSTKVVITEYDLPRERAMPHDVILDDQGTAWYTDFGHQFLGKLDPKTGKVTEYEVPMLKPDYPPGMLDINFDKTGDIWLGLMLQAGVAKFDRKTEKFTMYPLPADINNPAAAAGHGDADVIRRRRQGVDERVGIPGVHRMDLATQKFETFSPFADFPKGQEHSVYGIKADSQNNLYFMDFSADLTRAYRRQDRQVHASSRRRRRTRIRVAAGSTRRTGSGSPNTAPTSLRCSTPRPRSSPSGRCRRNIAGPTT